ncbi:SCO7613 C-terminal domain-containing membrane protein [Cellulomonas sp. P22]|uniref:SCO7613 C-terminal domain-containing membrane protein n=1 Tax=Cellulomonas sp. P22 TaxID=3373189 RepID=UPI0037B64260
MPDQPRGAIAAARRALLDAASCPACEAPLAAGWCAACGLDLRGPAGRELWTLSQEAEAALGRRVAHIERMRAGQLRPVAAPVAQAPVAQPPVPQRPVPAHPTPAAPPTARPPAAVPSLLPRSLPASPPPSARPAVGARPAWRVQTVLQVLGALLLAAACIVFLLFSWGWLGLVGRAAVIGVGTVVVFAVASRLRRADLGSSAEAVGGIATVMLLLDAWAVRATGLVDGASDALYAAVACLVCGVLLGAWGTRARLRIGTAAACVLVPLAPVLLTPVTGAVGLPWLLAASLALTTVRFAATPALGGVERAVLGAVAGAAAGLAAGSALMGLAVPDATRSWSAACVLLVLAGLTAVESRCAGRHATDVPASGAGRVGAVDRQAAGATTLARPTAWAAAAGTLLALGAAALALAAVRTGLPPTTLLALAPLGAGAASVALASLSQRPAPAPAVPAGVLDDRRPAPGPGATPPLRAATRGALAVTLGAGLPAVAVLLRVLLVQASALPAVVAPLTAAAGAGGALVVAATLRLCSAHPAARVVAAWTTVAALLSLPGTLTATWPETGPLARVGMLTGLVVLALLADRRPVLLGGRSRTPVRALAALAALLALVGGRDTFATGVALVVCGGVVLVARSWTPTGTGVRPLLLAGALGLGWLGVVTTTSVWWDPAQVALALAVVLLVAGAVVTLARAPWDGGDRRAVLGSAAVLALTGWWMGAVHVTPETPAVHRVAVVAVPVLATLVGVLVAAPGGALLGVPTRAAGAVVAASLAPSTVLAVGVASGGTVAWSALTVAAAAVAGACVLLAAPVSGSHETVRRSGEVAAWSMLTVQLLVVLGHVSAPGGPERTALVVALAALTAGCWSLRPDRRWARWWALGLATCASWVQLRSDDVGTPEAYLAPTGLVLVVVALRRVVRSQGHDVPLLAAGLGLLTLPTALLGGTLGTSAAPRALLALGAATVLLALGAAQRPAPAPTGGVTRRDVLCGIGALGALLGPALHALVAAADGHRDVSGVEAYSLPAAALLVVARRTLSQDLHPQPGDGATGRAARQPAVLWVVAAVAVLPTLAATDASTTGLVRWLAVLAAGGALMMLGARDVPRVTLLAIGTTAGSLATVVASASGAVRPFEVPVVAFAALVIATATVLAWHGRRSAGWTVVGPVLLGAAVVGPPEPWRAPMSLGVAAALLGVGIVLRRTAADSTPRAVAGSAAAPVPLVAALVVAGLVALSHGVRPPSGTTARLLDVEVWTVPATGVVAVALVLLASTWPFAGVGPRTWGLPLVVALATAPTLLAVDGTGAGSLRAAVVLVGGGALALAAVLHPERVPGPRTALVTGLVAAGAATLAAAVHPHLVPADAVLCAYGALLVAVGLARMGRSAGVGSWDALGAGLVLALVVPLGTGWVEPTTWRLLLVVTGALGAVVMGAARRWQAPFVLGAATLATVALVQVTPAAVAAVRVVEWWVVLAAVGAVLLGLGLTYERRLREAREATRFVATMR